MPSCPFCERLGSPEVLARDELTAAVADVFPLSPGHTLIVPRRHVADFFSLTTEEQAAMWQMVGVIRRILDERHHPDAYNVGSTSATVRDRTSMGAFTVPS